MRIQTALGNREEAKAFYRKAIGSIQQIRADLASGSSRLQLDFREDVEPVYRELLALLLAEEKGTSIQEALSVFELFQVAQLESFFQDICFQGEPHNPQTVLKKAHTAVITSILLKDTAYLILQLPDGSLHHYPVPIPPEKLLEKVKNWRDSLEDAFSNQYRKEAQALYDLLIRP